MAKFEKIFNYNSAITLLTSHNKFQIKPGLERIRKFLNIIGNPQENLHCIHVAGTNGKGSVCRILHAILVTAGKKVGLYSSPHLFDYTERISIGFEYISKSTFAKYILELNNIAQKNNIDLTEFELLTAVMFKYFSDNNVDIVVLETGLGGKYDATNVIKTNICSILTRIDFDHSEILGNTLTEILIQKAGIIKPNSPCFSYPQLTNITSEEFKTIISENNSQLIIAKPLTKTINYGLKGCYQQENLSIALSVIKNCFPEIEEHTIGKALDIVKNPFRYEYYKSKNILFDCAHNPSGICALIKSIDKDFPNSPRRFIFGALKTKDYTTMLNLLSKQIVNGVPPKFYFYKSHHPKAVEINKLQATCPYNSEIFTQSSRINYNDGYLTIVCGSMYMLGEIYKIII